MLERYPQHTAQRSRWEREINFATQLVSLIKQPEFNKNRLTTALKKAKLDHQKGMEIAERVLKSSWNLDISVTPTALLPLVTDYQKLKKKGQDLDFILDKVKDILSKKI